MTSRGVPVSLTACMLTHLVLSQVGALPAGADPENLATRAQVTASSSCGPEYSPRFVCDGHIPGPRSRADSGRAWAAKGNQHPNGARITFTWPEPVTIAEVVYWGRTAFDLMECWKDYEVRVGGSAAGTIDGLLETKGAAGPTSAGDLVAKGTLRAGHGGQRIPLVKPIVAQSLTITFLSSYGGPNPGAAEIRIYDGKASDSAIGEFVPAANIAASPAGTHHRPDSPELSAGLRSGELGFTRLVVAQRHHIRCSHVYTYHCEGQQNGGGLFVYDVARDELTQLVDSTDGQIQACDLSYDGRTILFGWRRAAAGSPYQLYTIGVDGSGLRQITTGRAHNFDGAWLPDGRIVFLSTRRTQAAYCFFTPVGILHTMNADGSDQRCISANYLNDFTPAVLNDGRIIYGRWEYVDRPAIPIQSLWTINPDGTMLQGFFGNRVLDPASFIEPQAIPGSSGVLCTLTGHNGSCRGAIGVVDPIYGDNDPAAIRNVTPDVPLRGVAISSNGPQGPYQTPYPVDAQYFLVSLDGTLVVRDYGNTETAVVLEPRNGIGFYNSRPIRPRLTAPVRPSSLPPDEHGEWATVLLQDVYRGLEPHVRRGEITHLAVVQEIPRRLISSPGIHRPAFGFQRVLVSCGATYVPKKVWGFVPVQPDGSACFRIPACLPIYFIALDAKGRGVQRMRSFTHLMPGEIQGCVGCHESRLTGPPSAPRPTSLERAPEKPEPPEWGVRGFCYASIVQPVLDAHCVRCHNARSKPKGIDLSGDRTEYFNISYEVLANKGQGRAGSPYISWIPTYNGHEGNILEIAPRRWGSPASPLAALVLNGHPDADGKPRVELPAAAQRRILTWIDLNVPYYGTADTAHPDRPACRGMRPDAVGGEMDAVFARRCQQCHTRADGRVGGAASASAPRLKRPTLDDALGGLETSLLSSDDTWIKEPLVSAAAAGRREDAAAVPGPPERTAIPVTWHSVADLRIENPERNDFLLAPLSKAAGGSGRCGGVVFASKDDPDYQRVLKAFQPIQYLLSATPRMDMPGAVAHASCCAAGN